MKRIAIMLAVLALCLPSLAMADGIELEGSIEAARVRTILAPYSGVAGDVDVRAGDALAAQTPLLSLSTTAVYADFDGVFNYKDDTYTIINMESMTDAMNLMTSMMMSLLVGIASIALVVGGIGIMNMMLVTVTERTTEIGLRKALGAEPGQIQMQFLIEAIILSLLGGVIGVIVGLTVSFAICMNTDITFSLNTFAIMLGVSFSAAVGIIFGWAPARKASNLNPIDALRSI